MSVPADLLGWGYAAAAERLGAEVSAREAGLSQPHILPQASLTLARGGRLVRVAQPTCRHGERRQQFEIAHTGKPDDHVRLGYDDATGEPVLGPPGYVHRRKLRGRVHEFSRLSRVRMMQKLAVLDRSSLKIKPLFVTLTYPGEWSDDGREWKRHLQALKKRLYRAQGYLPLVWKLEFQKRGAPHFHLMVFWDIDDIYLWLFRRWLSEVWYEIVASGDKRHLHAGTKVERIRDENGIMWYCAKYMAKVNNEVRDVGRHWGVWYWNMIDVSELRAVLTPSEFYRVRRVLWRLLGFRRGPSARGSRNYSAWRFMSEGQAMRLLEWVGT